MVEIKKFPSEELKKSYQNNINLFESIKERNNQYISNMEYIIIATCFGFLIGFFLNTLFKIFELIVEKEFILYFYIFLAIILGFALFILTIFILKTFKNTNKFNRNLDLNISRWKKIIKKF